MSMITRREFLRVSAVAAAGAALVACSPAATEAPMEEEMAGEEGGEEMMEEEAMPERPKDFPLGDVPRNRTLIYYHGTSIAGNAAMYGGDRHQDGNAFIVEPCAYYGVHADKDYPWLAESYSYNDDATELTINFRKGIMWSDGTPFTAADPAWSIETLKRVDGLQRQGNVRQTVESVEAVDDTTLVIKLNQTDWRFFFTSLTFRFDLGDYTVIQPKHYWETVADEDLLTDQFYDMAAGLPISTSAWGVGESNEQITNYDLHSSWWAVDTGFVEKEPDVWRIQIQNWSNETLAAQLLINKEVDHPLDLRPFVVASMLAQGDHLSTWTGRKPPYGYVDWWPISVQFSTMKPPFDNPKVRWAVAYALDQQRILDIAWNGAGTVAYSPFPDYPKLVALLGDIKEVTDKYNVLEYNLEKSAGLMEEAGFTKDAEGFWVDADGVRPEADIYGDAGLFGDLAPVVAEELRKGGFFTQHKSPPEVWANSVDGTAPMFLFGHGGATIDPFDTLQLYQEANSLPMGEQSWGNITRWDDPEFAAVRQEMKNVAMDDPKMKDLFAQAMTIWYEALPDCPLVQWYHRIPVNTWYWENWPNEEDPYMNSALWHFTAPIVVFGLKATGNA